MTNETILIDREVLSDNKTRPVEDRPVTVMYDKNESVSKTHPVTRLHNTNKKCVLEESRPVSHSPEQVVSVQKGLTHPAQRASLDLNWE